MTTKVSLYCLLLIALTCVGCARGYTRLFQPVAPDQILVDNYRVYPRVTAFRNAPESTARLIGQDFWTSLRVYDTTIQAGDLSDSTYLLRRDSLALEFLKTALTRFVVDSLVLKFSPDSTRLPLAPDLTRFTPRDVNYFSYNFGKITIPLNISAIRAVFFYRLYTAEGEFVRGDTVAVPMVRIERNQMLVTDILEADSAVGFRGN
jgi:hypothetical protein